MKEKPEKLWNKTAENWPSEFVARSKINEFTGGLYCGKTFTNKSKEFGLTKYYFHRKVAFNKWELASFMAGRITRVV